MTRIRLSILGSMAAILVASGAMAALIFADHWLERLVLSLTLAAFSAATIAVVYRRGVAQFACLGFAIFGWGYMAFASPIYWDGDDKHVWRNKDGSRLGLVTTTAILDSLYPYFQRERGPADLPASVERWLASPTDRAILTRLDLPIGTGFPDVPSLEQLKKTIQQATQDQAAGLADGILIEFDDKGLEDADRSPSSTVTIHDSSQPLNRLLRETLSQLGLRYYVQDGRMTITADSVKPGMLVSSVGAGPIHSFRKVGHCYWAILFGSFGALASGLTARCFLTSRPRNLS